MAGIFRTTALAGTFAGALLATAASPAAGQSRQTDDSFRWSGPVSEGAWVNVRNMNGGVRVESGTGSQVQVRATKQWRTGNADDVQIRVTRYGPDDRNILVCALWGDNTVCTEDNYRSRNDTRGNRRSNDTNVQLVVTLPRGVHVKAATVNGSVDVTGATGEVDVNSVNGNVRAESTGGPVTARAVNGNLTARMGRISTTEDLTYSTVNGNVLVEFGDDLNAEIEMSTVNGGFETNFPLTVRGRINPKNIRATVGSGGSRVKLSTVNGNVELRKN